MSEQGGTSETLTITLLNIQNLKGLKGDTVQAIVKVEFGDKVLGESGKVECLPDSLSELNYTTHMTLSSDDPLALDDLACKPLVCTVVEVLPKEKKQKEEKTAVLGQCSVDLTPLLIGEPKHKLKMQIIPASGSPMENLPPDHPKPELEIQLSLDESIFKGVHVEETNIINITVESLFSPPESWNMSAGFNYVAATPVPLAGEKENIVVFTGGQIKPGLDKEMPNRRKKWAVPGSAQGAAVYIGDKTISSDAVEEENGDLRTPEDQEFRKVAEHEKFHLTWNIERRCFLDISSAKVLKERISKCRYLPVEVFRTILPAPGRLKGKDDDAISFHGVAYIDISPLLYPGVKRIRGAYKVTAFSDQELLEKTNRRAGLAEEAARIANGILARNISPVTKLGGKKEDNKTVTKIDKKPSRANSVRKSGSKSQSVMKKPSSLKPVGEGATTISETESQQPVNVEGMHYVEARSYVMVEIELQKPLIRKKEATELALRISALAPPRPQFPKKTNSAQKAVDDFHNQVGIVSNLLLDEFREHFNDGLSSYQTDSVEEKRQKLTYHLNASGKYLALKEQLKYSVVKIVREKYLKTSNFQDKNELQAFLSELYVYLIDEMHVGFGKVLAIEDQRPVPAPLTDSIQLKHFAREAEVNENFELAAKFYQERISRDRNDPGHWLDYGTFCLYLNDLTKAEECFRECVAIDQRHMHGLLLNGIVCSMLERNESAETFFEAAASYEPKSILAWTLFGLFYLGIGNEIGAEMALAEADRLNVAAAVAASLPPAPASTEIQVTTEEGDRAESPEKKMVEGEEKARTDDDKFITDEEKLEQSPERNDRLKKTEKVSGESTEKKESKEDGKVRKSSKRPSSTSPNRPSSSHSGKPSSGQLRPSTSRKKSARAKAQEGAIRGRATTAEAEEVAKSSMPPEPAVVPSQSIYMQAVEFLLDAKATPFTERALARHLVDPLGGPSSKYFICLAQLKLQKHQMDEVEADVKDAMQMDHQCPDAWAIMGHMKYLTGDTDGAKNCYERTLAFVADASEMHSIYLRLASIYLQEGQFYSARDTFLIACKRSPSCVSWLGVGIACYRLGDFADAEDALTEANILDNMDPEVWAYLCLVCLQTGRRLEAEQAYKYTLKLNLQDDELLAEIHHHQEVFGFGNPQF